MQNIGFVIATFAVAFGCQVVWWRVRRPGRQIFAILVLYPVVLLLTTGAGLWSGLLDVDVIAYARLALLYLASVLSYAIVFSAVEVASPTLNIVSFIADKEPEGCPEGELRRRFMGEDEVMGRLRLMEVGGLISIESQRCHLTRKGAFYARLFGLGALLFALPQGG
jgi:hypothetical protein